MRLEREGRPTASDSVSALWPDEPFSHLKARILCRPDRCKHFADALSRRDDERAASALRVNFCPLGDADVDLLAFRAHKFHDVHPARVRAAPVTPSGPAAKGLQTRR